MPMNTGSGKNDRLASARKAAKPDPFNLAFARSNSLGLSAHDLALPLDELDVQDSPGSTSVNRRFVRRAFRKPTIPLQLMLQGGATPMLNMACRNISRGGISVLHSLYVHTGTACAVTIPKMDGTPLVIAGTVVRCMHRRGIMHELGIKFNEVIDLKNILEQRLFSDWFSLEYIDPTELTGTILVVEDSEANRRLVRHHLRNTSLRSPWPTMARRGYNEPLMGTTSSWRTITLGTWTLARC